MRLSGDFPVGDGIVILSTKCVWRSVTFWPESVSSSSMEPTHTVSPSTLRHTGRGVPQKRFREMAQSRAPSSQLPKRPSRR